MLQNNDIVLKRMRKLLGAILNPLKWGKIYSQIWLYGNNVIKYHNFSFNLNSKYFWDNELSKFQEFWRNENYCHILPLLPEDRAFSLLDIGCAIGDGCELIKEKLPKAEITGIDISEIGIEKAKRKTKGVKYFVRDILKDSIAQTYDYITIIETLEHFDNPFTVVDKCLTHVKNTLIVSTPYTADFSGKRYVVGEHRYCFNETTFAKYSSRVVGITEHGNTEKEVVIIYEIRP